MLACRRGPWAGGPRPEAGQRVGRALELRGCSGEGQREPPSPHPTPPYSLLEARTLRKDDTPFSTGPSDGLQEPPWRPSGPGGSLQVSALPAASQPFTCWDPCLTPTPAAASPPFQAAASAPHPHPHLTPPVQQPLKYRLNLAHTCLNLLEFLPAPWTSPSPSEVGASLEVLPPWPPAWRLLDPSLAPSTSRSLGSSCLFPWPLLSGLAPPVPRSGLLCHI